MNVKLHELQDFKTRLSKIRQARGKQIENLIRNAAQEDVTVYLLCTLEEGRKGQEFWLQQPDWVRPRLHVVSSKCVLEDGIRIRLPELITE